MCPACFATLALTTAGGTAAGGLSVLTLRRLMNRRKAFARRSANTVNEQPLKEQSL